MAYSSEEIQRRIATPPKVIHSRKWKCIITILDQAPGREDIVIEKKEHPCLFWFNQEDQKWTFSICDEPTGSPFWVSSGLHTGYTVTGQFTNTPEGSIITEEEANAIIEHHLDLYKKEYGYRVVANYQSTRAAEHPNEKDEA